MFQFLKIHYRMFSLIAIAFVFSAISLNISNEENPAEAFSLSENEHSSCLEETAEFAHNFALYSEGDSSRQLIETNCRVNSQTTKTNHRGESSFVLILVKKTFRILFQESDRDHFPILFYNEQPLYLRLQSFRN